MTNHIEDQMGGMVLIEISGQQPEQLMNLLMSRGVFIQNIQKQENGMRFKIRGSALASAQALAEEQGLSLKVLHHTGVPAVRKKMKRHLVLGLGLVAIVGILYTATSFFWFVDVDGNEKVSREDILQAAHTCGLYIGAFQPNVNRFEVEENLLRCLPELSYAEIRIQGVKAHIQVVERVLAEDDIQSPCDIIARCDGVVEELLLQEGQAQVQKGDAVLKGQILISGTILPPEEEETEQEKEKLAATEATEEENEEENVEQQEPILVRARGVVKARVWYEGYGEAPIWQEERKLSGRETKSIQLSFPWKPATLLDESTCPYTAGTMETKKHVLTTPWGELGWQETVWQEEIVKQVEYRREEAFALAQKQAVQDLLQAQGWTELPDEAQFETISQPSDTVIRVQVLVEKIEDIAVAQKMEEQR